MSYAIGIDIGGTQTKLIRVSPDGRMLDRHETDTGDEANAWRPATRQWVAAVEQQHGPAQAIGVCGPGIARPDGSGISWMVGRMEGLVDFDFTRHLGRTRPVPVLNDALAALLGEVWLGAGRGLSDVIMLTLGTGVGGAIFSQGRLLKGHSGRAGHLGHTTVNADGPADVCGMPGSIEYYIGNYSLAERSGGRFTDTAALVQAHLAGDGQASRIWLDSVRRLAVALAGMINVLDPTMVILGGGVAQSGPALFDPLAAAINGIEWRPQGVGVPIVPAALGSWAGAIGAARNALLEGEA